MCYLLRPKYRSALCYLLSVPRSLNSQNIDRGRLPRPEITLFGFSPGFDQFAASTPSKRAAVCFQVSSFKLACLKSSSFKLARLGKELQYAFKFALICHLLKNQVSFLEECEYNNAEKLICWHNIFDCLDTGTYEFDYFLSMFDQTSHWPRGCFVHCTGRTCKKCKFTSEWQLLTQFNF